MNLYQFSCTINNFFLPPKLWSTQQVKTVFSRILFHLSGSISIQVSTGDCLTVSEGVRALMYSSETMQHDNTKALEYLAYIEETLQHLNQSFKKTSDP